MFISQGSEHYGNRVSGTPQKVEVTYQRPCSRGFGHFADSFGVDFLNVCGDSRGNVENKQGQNCLENLDWRNNIHGGSASTTLGFSSGLE